MPSARPVAVPILAAADLAVSVVGAMLGVVLALLFWVNRGEIVWHAGVQTLVVGVVVLTILQNVLLFVAGLGLAFGRRWGRRLALLYGWSGIVQAGGLLLVGAGWIAFEAGANVLGGLLALVLLVGVTGSASLVPVAQVVVCGAPIVRDYFASGGDQQRH